MRHFALIFLLYCVPVFAKSKPKVTYQDGIYESVRGQIVGSHCAGSANTDGNFSAETENYGTSSSTDGTVRASSNSASDCRAVTRGLYTIKVGENVYVLTPYISVIQAVGANSPLLRAFQKPSILSTELPGSHIQVRSQDGSFYIKVGKRESRYTLVEAKK